MFLIDQPFASDFLIQTIKEKQFKIVATPTAQAMINDDALNWVSEEAAISILKKNPLTPLYTNSENSIAWINQHLPASALSKQIETFKNKVAFRDLVQDAFPAFFFKAVKLEDLPNLDITEIKFPFVLKPSVGFFSLGVYIIRNNEDWLQAQQELKVDNLENSFPKEVIDSSTFIIEEYIEGEEYAIDSYFDKDGEVVILNILHHKFSSAADTSDRVYSTSQKIIETHLQSVSDFLQPIGDQLGLKNFPLHLEIRITPDGEIFPIEVNPLRFGGFCTTADLSGHAFQFNSYEYFTEGKKPDWKTIFQNKIPKKYSIVVLNNNSGITAAEVSAFNYDLLENEFEKVMECRRLDIKKYPVFGFLFTETSLEKQAELERILNSDLRKYIVTDGMKV